MKFKLSQAFVVLLALMSGSVHRAGGILAEGLIKYYERNRNVYLGKVCAQMYTMKTRGNEPTFSKNERKCAATLNRGANKIEFPKLVPLHVGFPKYAPRHTDLIN